uniref:Uncharacterized protein n=1 Tax=Arundo donax TaxID=35708 RepID=A0A0A9CC75_ARUDO
MCSIHSEILVQQKKLLKLYV